MSEISVSLATDHLVVTEGRATVTASVTNLGGRLERVVLSVARPGEVPGGLPSADPGWSNVDQPRGTRPTMPCMSRTRATAPSR